MTPNIVPEETTPNWEVMPILPEPTIKGMVCALSDWYWVEHPDTGFNGQEGVLEFLDGKAVYAPEKIQEDGANDWFVPDGVDSVLQVRQVPLWILLWCWHQNGFTVRAMDGNRTEWEEYEAAHS